jgi:hypothetical protein
MLDALSDLASSGADTECDSGMYRLPRAPPPANHGSPGRVLVGASRLNKRHGGKWLPRQVDGEHASSPRQVARIDPAIVRFSAPSAEGEAKTYAGAIGAALLERAKELVGIPAWQAAALVLDLDEHALGACANPECDGRPRPRELEGVLEKVSDYRGKHLSVGRNRQGVVDRRDDQSDATRIRIQCRRRRDFLDEPCNAELLPVLNALRETYFRQRTIHKRV